MNWTNIQPKVSAGVFGGAVVALILGLLKAKWNIDLAGQEANLMIVVTGLVSYFFPNGEQK